MRELTQTEAIDLVGRFEAGQEIPERMRADVRMLGSLLGRVLRESGSPGLFEDVERLRVATIQAYTDETPAAFARAQAIADSFTVQRADEVARAFTCYFHLVNLAEEHQRVRILRERDGRPDREDATDSVAAAFVRLAAEVGDDTALARLQALRFHPVFTAHPTEARRRAVSTSIRRLAALLEERDGMLRNGADERRAERRMLEEVDTLWRTAPLRPEKPSPVDEVRAVMSVFDETLYTAVPHVYRRVDDALQGPAAGGRAPIVRPFVRIGSWVGGDRDGNPFVTASVTRKAAAIASEHVLLGLERTALPHRPRADPGCRDHAPERRARRALAAAEGRRRGRRGRDRQALPRRAAPPHPAAARPQDRRDPRPRRRPRLPRPRAPPRRPAGRAGLARRARAPRVRRTGTCSSCSGRSRPTAST